MKKCAPLFVAIANVSFFYCFSQKNIQNVISNDQQLVVVSYHVEERINMNFGSRITTYNVPSLDYIERKDLGENNSRKITPKYAKVRTKLNALRIDCDKKPKQLFKSFFIISQLVDSDVIAPKKRARPFVTIDVVGTYERVMDKGYRSVDMLTKVADRHFFDGNLILAAKWYSELFENKTDLGAVYYYRYAQSLLGVGETVKGNEMMKIFETKSL
jgi:hypothetical protein